MVLQRIHKNVSQGWEGNVTPFGNSVSRRERRNLMAIMNDPFIAMLIESLGRKES